MKNQIKILNSFLALALVIALFACSQDKVDPNLVLDDVFLPDGYHQVDNPSSKALARLQELRLENPSDHFYYLQRVNANSSSQDWIFPQKELKIEFVDYDESAKNMSNVQGVIVKKITGNWNNEVFMIVEGKPSPQGGMKAFNDYIFQNIKYPEAAKKSGIEGKVYVEFVVDEQGTLTNVKAVRGIGSGCDEEAVRVLKEAPKWTPALIGGKPGKVKMIMPVNYKLS